MTQIRTLIYIICNWWHSWSGLRKSFLHRWLVPDLSERVKLGNTIIKSNWEATRAGTVWSKKTLHTCIYVMGIDFACFSSMIFLNEFMKCSDDVVFYFHCFTSLRSWFIFLETKPCSIRKWYTILSWREEERKLMTTNGLYP